MAATPSNDFVIWGPAIAAGNHVLNAVHALYYLPNYFTLVLPPAQPQEKAAYRKVLSLIRRDELGSRVRFSRKQVPARGQAVIVPSPAAVQPGHVFGRSPEALASAILRVARDGA